MWEKERQMLQTNKSIFLIYKIERCDSWLLYPAHWTKLNYFWFDVWVGWVRCGQKSVQLLQIAPLALRLPPTPPKQSKLISIFSIKICVNLHRTKFWCCLFVFLYVAIWLHLYFIFRCLFLPYTPSPAVLLERKMI